MPSVHCAACLRCPLDLLQTYGILSTVCSPIYLSLARNKYSRKPARSSDRRSGGRSHRDPTRSHRRRSSSTRDKECRNDDVGGSDSSLSRMKKAPAAMTASEKGDRDPAGGNGGRKETKAGGWFATQEEEEEKQNGESRTHSDAEDIGDGEASKNSCTDTTLSSKQRYDGKGRKLLQGGSSDEGQGGDEGEGNGDGGVGGRCWRELSERMPARCNSLMLSYERGNTSDLVQCIIVRDVSSWAQVYGMESDVMSQF